MLVVEREQGSRRRGWATPGGAASIRHAIDAAGSSAYVMPGFGRERCSLSPSSEEVAGRRPDEALAWSRRRRSPGGHAALLLDRKHGCLGGATRALRLLLRHPRVGDEFEQRPVGVPKVDALAGPVGAVAPDGSGNDRHTMPSQVLKCLLYWPLPNEAEITAARPHWPFRDFCDLDAWTMNI